VPKDVYYLKHDTNAAHDPKVEAMVHRYGMAGYGRYWRLAELLREQEGGKLRRDKWCNATLAQCWKCSPEKAGEFLSSLLEDFELLSADDDFIWSDRILRDMATMEKHREDGRNGALMRWHKSPNGQPIANQSHPNTRRGRIGEEGKKGGASAISG